MPPIASVVPSRSSVVHRPSSISKPARPSSPAIDPRLMLVVVVAQDRELAQPGLQRARGAARSSAMVSSSSTRSPVMTTRSAVQPRQASTTGLEEPALEAGREVEVAELDDLQAIERLGQVRDRHVPLAELQAGTTRCAGSRSSQESPAVADQGGGPARAGPGRASRDDASRSPRAAAAGR